MIIMIILIMIGRTLHYTLPAQAAQIDTGKNIYRYDCCYYYKLSTYIYIYIYIHTYMHTYIHTYINTYIYMLSNRRGYFRRRRLK